MSRLGATRTAVALALQGASQLRVVGWTTTCAVRRPPFISLQGSSLCGSPPNEGQSRAPTQLASDCTLSIRLARPLAPRCRPCWKTIGGSDLRFHGRTLWVKQHNRGHQSDTHACHSRSPSSIGSRAEAHTHYWYRCSHRSDAVCRDVGSHRRSSPLVRY